MMVSLNILKNAAQNNTSSKNLLIPLYHWHLILTGLDTAQSRLHVLYLGNKGPISGGWDVWMDIWKPAGWLVSRMCSIVHLDGGFEWLLPRAVIHWFSGLSPLKRRSRLLEWKKRWGPIIGEQMMYGCQQSMHTNPHLRFKCSVVLRKQDVHGILQLFGWLTTKWEVFLKHWVRKVQSAAVQTNDASFLEIHPRQVSANTLTVPRDEK